MKWLYVYVTLLLWVCSGAAWSAPLSPNRAPMIVQTAKATPNPVTGRTAALSVLADDDGGESKLVYTWKVSSQPSGGTATFSVNRLNAAKNTTAYFTMAGSYVFSVTAADAAGLSVTTTLAVVVNFP